MSTNVQDSLIGRKVKSPQELRSMLGLIKKSFSLLNERKQVFLPNTDGVVYETDQPVRQDDVLQAVSIGALTAFYVCPGYWNETATQTQIDHWLKNNPHGIVDKSGNMYQRFGEGGETVAPEPEAWLAGRADVRDALIAGGHLLNNVVTLDRPEGRPRKAARPPIPPHIPRFAKRFNSAEQFGSTTERPGEAAGGGEPSKRPAKAVEALAERQPVQFTCITNRDGLLAKVYSLDEHGRAKAEARAHIVKGQHDRGDAETLDEFMLIRAELAADPSCCLVYGIAQSECGGLTLKRLRDKHPGSIARCREDFTFPAGQPGVLVFDFDRDKRAGAKRWIWQELDSVVCEILPELEDTRRAWVPSSSAFIRDKNGNELIGAGGWRLYVFVDNAAAIPRITEYAYQRLWARGHGRIEFGDPDGDCCQALDRSLLDIAMAQPEREDFIAEPVLKDGLYRKLPDEFPMLLGQGGMLRTGDIPLPEPMDLWRRTCAVLLGAKAAAEPERRTKIERVTEKHLQAAREANPGKPDDELRRDIRRVLERQDGGLLPDSFVLYQGDGKPIAAGELRRDRKRYEGLQLRSVAEPDYNGGHLTAKCHLNPGSHRMPVICDLAHGLKTVYRLSGKVREIELIPGTKSEQLTDYFEVLKECPELFERGERLTLVSEQAGSLLSVSAEWINATMDEMAAFYSTKQEGKKLVKVNKDAPDWVGKRVLAKKELWSFANLRGIITAPILNFDGMIVCEPGFDAITELYLVQGEYPAIPEYPSMDELKTAFARLWRPFKEFPFDGPDSRGVLIAAVLTGVMRPLLDKAPGFAFVAPMPGTGKTYLAQCIAAIAGAGSAVRTWPEDEDEMLKVIITCLLAGRRCIFFDNADGVKRSNHLEGMLTSGEFEGRVLGSNQDYSGTANPLILITGNNFTPAGALPRRLITCRLDAECERPERRVFHVQPVDDCRRHRQELVAAALTLLRSFMRAGCPRQVEWPVGGFESWDKHIRQCVLWLNAQGISIALGDPAGSQENARAENPDVQKLEAFLTAVYGVHGEGKWTAQTLAQEAVGHARDDWAKQLNAAVNAIAAPKGIVDTLMLGHWIKKHRDVRGAGYRLMQAAEKSHGATQWQVLLA